MKAAATQAGDTVVIFGVGKTEALNENTDLAYEMVKRELVTRGYTIKRTVPIIYFGQLFGYGIEADVDIYSALLEASTN